jgi:hypothetical protein
MLMANAKGVSMRNVLVCVSLGVLVFACGSNAEQASPTADLDLSTGLVGQRLRPHHDAGVPVVDAGQHDDASSVDASGSVDAGQPTGVVSAAIASIIPEERLTNWQPGLNAIGGIPARTTVCATLAPSGGDDTAAIQAAIEACPANQVVQLGSGTFQITGQGLAIDRSDVTLRGAGSTSTRLVKKPGTDYPVVIIGNRWPKYTDQTALVADALKETSAVTLGGAPPSGVPLAVGELVIVDHLTNDLTWWGTRSPPGDPSRGWFSEMDRPIGQVLEVQSVAGNHVTFTTSFHTDFLVADGAQLTRFQNNGVPVTAPIQMSGIEDLYVEYGEGGDGGGNLHLFATKACWVKGVESNHSSGHSVNLDGAFRSEVRDSFFHSTVDPNPGGAGYGMGMSSYAADNLFENNISWNFNKVIVMRATGGGNVVAYNYMEDGYGAGYPTIVEIGLNASHMTTPHYELFEGNEAFNFDSDSVWGNAVYITAYRNHLTTLRRSIGLGTPDGVQVALVDQQNRRAVGLSINHWYYSFVANVLGYPNGYLQYPNPFSPEVQSPLFVYAWAAGTVPGGNEGTQTPLWQIGYDGNNWLTTPDAQVVATTLRHGNYDYLTNGIVWDPTIASHTLPPSLYLTSRPAFFGSSPWPWVTPESGTTQVATLPARARFDAIASP